MSFKDISYLELWQPLCSVDWNHLFNIGRRHHENYFEFGPVVQVEMLFKGISFLELLQPFCSEEQFCEIILNLRLWFRSRCHLKDFLSGALAALLFGEVEPFMQF